MNPAPPPAASLLPGTVAAAPPGVKGFDVNQPLSTTALSAFFAKGYRYCIRYVGRRVMKPHDLSTAEAKRILAAGMALMPVQHVELPGWHPTAALGLEYGTNAARFCKQLGFPPGVCVWLDLEEVADHTPPENVIAFCNTWHGAVAEAGYVPGVYVGFKPGLTGSQLFFKLRFQHYWGAFNVDVTIPHRGWQLKQKVSSGGVIAGIPRNEYDDDVTRTDDKGGTVLWLIDT